MAEDSKIEWCDHTVNLWWGCAKVHTGCKNCYAENLSDMRYKKGLWGENASRQRIKSAFKDLDRYQKTAAAEGTFIKIFCGSMMDIFEDEKAFVSEPKYFLKYTSDLRHYLFFKIFNNEYPNLIFLFLTKRPENILSCIPVKWATDAPTNVWFGTSISDQKTADLYVNRLQSTTLTNLFLSIEPQVRRIDTLDLSNIKWVIQGGESGPNKRPFDIEWAYHVKNLCKEAKVPYFFKQIDKVQPIPDDLFIREFPKFINSNTVTND